MLLSHCSGTSKNPVADGTGNDLTLLRMRCRANKTVLKNAPLPFTFTNLQVGFPLSIFQAMNSSGLCVTVVPVHPDDMH